MGLAGRDLVFLADGSCSLGGGEAGREGALGVGTSQPPPPRGDCSGQASPLVGEGHSWSAVRLSWSA